MTAGYTSPSPSDIPLKGGNKTIYIRAEDYRIWAAAQAIYGEQLAPLIMALLKRYVNEKNRTMPVMADGKKLTEALEEWRKP